MFPSRIGIYELHWTLNADNARLCTLCISCCCRCSSGENERSRRSWRLESTEEESSLQQRARLNRIKIIGNTEQVHQRNAVKIFDWSPRGLVLAERQLSCGGRLE